MEPSAKMTLDAWLRSTYPGERVADQAKRDCVKGCMRVTHTMIPVCAASKPTPAQVRDVITEVADLLEGLRAYHAMLEVR